MFAHPPRWMEFCGCSPLLPVKSCRKTKIDFLIFFFYLQKLSSPAESHMVFVMLKLECFVIADNSFVHHRG